MLLNGIFLQFQQKLLNKIIIIYTSKQFKYQGRDIDVLVQQIRKFIFFTFYSKIYENFY